MAKYIPNWRHDFKEFMVPDVIAKSPLIRDVSSGCNNGPQFIAKSERNKNCENWLTLNVDHPNKKMREGPGLRYWIDNSNGDILFHGNNPVDAVFTLIKLVKERDQATATGMQYPNIT
jgi:hypothetical protein